jgi:drug/metabolite transporter (DMT)-like permease
VPPNLRGAAFMTAAMAGFAAEDVFVKAAAREAPLGSVLIVVGALGVLFFAALARRQGGRAYPRALVSPHMLLRAALELAGRLFYALAVALTPLSSAAAILQAAPLLVAAGAAVLFGERVGPVRWLSIAAGFAGVLVILRPGLDGFSPLSLLAVAAMAGFAGRDLATRAAPAALSNAQLGVAGFLVVMLAGAAMLPFHGSLAPLGPAAAALAAGAAVFGIAGYHFLTIAMRTGEVGAVTPFRYTRLVFAMILATVVFGERPDAATLAGAGLIVAAGLVALARP